MFTTALVNAEEFALKTTWLFAGDYHYDVLKATLLTKEKEKKKNPVVAHSDYGL